MPTKISDLVKTRKTRQFTCEGTTFTLDEECYCCQALERLCLFPEVWHAIIRRLEQDPHANGIGLIVELLRYYTGLGLRKGDDIFKLNHNHKAAISRMIALLHPEHAHRFKKRTLRAMRHYCQPCWLHILLPGIK